MIWVKEAVIVEKGEADPPSHVETSSDKDETEDSFLQLVHTYIPNLINLPHSQYTTFI